MIKIKKGKPQKQESNDSGKNSKEMVTNRNNVSKKRKMESDKVTKKKIKTEHQEDTEEGKSLTYKVKFPHGGKCYKEIVQKVINSSESVLRPEVLTIKFASEEEAKQKSAELQKLSVGGLNLFLSSEDDDIVKRVIYLKQDFKELEKLKKFYGAVAVEQLMSLKGNLSHKFELTFKSEADSMAASGKIFKIGNKSYGLQIPNLESPTKEVKKKEAQNASNDKNQTKGKKIVQQQKKSKVKMLKTKTVNGTKQTLKKKTVNETKQTKKKKS